MTKAPFEEWRSLVADIEELYEIDLITWKQYENCAEYVQDLHEEALIHAKLLSRHGTLISYERPKHRSGIKLTYDTTNINRTEAQRRLDVLEETLERMCGLADRRGFTKNHPFRKAGIPNTYCSD